MTQLDEAFRAVWRDIANLVTRTERLETQEIPYRTRRVPLVPVYDRRTGAAVVLAADTHGSYSNITHIDETEANANFKVVGYTPIVMPTTGYSTGDTVNLKFQALSAGAGGNYVWDLVVTQFSSGSAPTSLLSASSEVFAASTSANTIETHTKALTTNPTPGYSLWAEISMNSNSTADTSTGTRALYNAWLEYTGP